MPVKTDWEAAEAYLGSRTSISKDTRVAYSRAMSRLFLWAWIVKKKPVSSLMHWDLVEYVSFCKDPQPREFWCGQPSLTKGSDWKPFARGEPSPTFHWALGVNAMFDYWVNIGYITGNPVGDAFDNGWRRDGRRASRPRAIQQVYDGDDWKALTGAIELLPRENPAEEMSAERARFLFSLLSFLGPQLAHVCSGRMNSFRLEGGIWFWRPPLTNPRSQPIKLPVPDGMITALTRYRACLGLSALPGPRDDLPLIMRVSRMQNSDLDRTAAERKLPYYIVRTVAALAANQLPEELKHKADALRLMTYGSARKLAIQQRKG
ncbi:hypothetical protein [Paraburkholderia sp. GAS42]|uniref:hypothetical protein n=1 Tax=Paraburkholderia sp. GAS42 TaxID=3035135 RepID=UPI003D1D1D08